jgi:integrase
VSGGYIEDRWLKKRPNKETDKRERTALWGKVKRYRVKGVAGVKDRSFEGATEAKDWLARAKADSRRGEFTDPRDGAILLGVFATKHWLANHHSRGSTRVAIEGRTAKHIVPHLGKYPLNTIGSERLEWWTKQLRKTLSASTAEQCWNNLSSCLSSAVAAGRIPKNPCKENPQVRPKVSGARKARAWDRDVSLRVRDELPLRYRALADLGFGCGMRQGETFGFSMDDLDDEGFVNVVRQVLIIKGKLYFGPPKGGKTRRVPAPPGVRRRLEEHAQRVPSVKVTLPWLDPDASDEELTNPPNVTVSLATPTAFGNAVSRHYFNAYVWKPTLHRAGLVAAVERKTPRKEKPGRQTPPLWQPSRELGFHTTRHTFASVQLEAGESIVTLSQWLGHADPSITLKYYAHFMPGAGSRGIAAMDAWFSG